MATAITFTIGSYTYNAIPLSPKKAFHVARKIGPALAEGITEIIESMGGIDQVTAMINGYRSAEDIPPLEMLQKLAPPLADALASLSDDDADYVLDRCLEVVTRQQTGATGWARITASSGDLMFDDITTPIMMQIAFQVIWSNLKGFFPADEPTIAPPKTP